MSSSVEYSHDLDLVIFNLGLDSEYYIQDKLLKKYLDFLKLFYN